MRISELFRYFIIISLLVACSTSQSEEAVADHVATHLSRTIEAYQSAQSLWDRLLEGETVSCAETFDAPPPLVLTQEELQQAPQSIKVQQPLNDAIQDIQQLLLMWELECQNEQPFVALERVRIAQDYLQSARVALEQAIQAWYVWQP
ncbi:MAG: hypothetical protein CUN55_04810 [Phototrophicales bacterium]|nr:MAG: hypothetical protein CUN55_04810 [Phototrophicales bacterium]